MNLFKQHIGRRVAGVGIGVALLMLGLEAPAFAAVTITGISPTNGPNNCVVVVTGTGFKDFPEAQTTVDFMPGPIAQTNFTVIDDTTMWVAVSGLTAGNSYTVRVTNPSNSPTGVTSTATFLATTAAGACAPTITSFTPTCGAAGTTVVITGTNLIDTDLDGADVYFSPYDTAAPPARLAAHSVPDVDDVTSLSVVVPSTTTTVTNSGTTDGPIKVITDLATGGTVFSSTSFLVPPPDCPAVGGTPHARSISLSLRKHLVARGKVTVGDGFTDCAAAVPVKIQRRVSGHWKTVGSTTTSDTGAYKKRIRDKAGKYRAKAPKVSLGTPVTDICSGATSPVRKVT